MLLCWWCLGGGGSGGLILIEPRRCSSVGRAKQIHRVVPYRSTAPASRVGAPAANPVEKSLAVGSLGRLSRCGVVRGGVFGKVRDHLPQLRQEGRHPCLREFRALS